MKNSIFQSLKINQEEAVQLENFVNLLVELKIIDSPEQVSPVLPVETGNIKDFSPIEIELLQSPVQFQVSAASSISSIINWEATLEYPQRPTSLPSSQDHLTATANQNLDNPNPDNSEDEIAAFQKLQELLG